MEYRFATVEDAAALASFNSDLIRDEGHRNAMSLAELEARMAAWLRGEYQAVFFIENECRPVGYALFRREVGQVYLRQFFVVAKCRRRGIGRAAFEWLRRYAWGMERRVRLDVLIGNVAGIAFWRAMGFRDYCLTLELDEG